METDVVRGVEHVEEGDVGNELNVTGIRLGGRVAASGRFTISLI